MEEEMVDVVDEEDNVVRTTGRKEVREKNLLHRAIRFIMINDKNEFLLQKRSKNKDIFPGVWDMGLAETAQSGENYDITAMRGLNEELSINYLDDEEIEELFVFSLKYRSDIHKVNCKVYTLYYQGIISPQESEIDEIKFKTKDQIIRLMEKEKFHPVGKAAFEKWISQKKS